MNIVRAVVVFRNSMKGLQKAVPRDGEKPYEYIGLYGTVDSYTRQRGVCAVTWLPRYI